MKQLLIALLFTSFAFGQIDIKDTRKYWVKDGDSIIGGYSNNQANALEKLLNYKMLKPESKPSIISIGDITVAANLVTEKVLETPKIDSITIENDLIIVYVDKDTALSDLYEVTINEQSYSNVKLETPINVYMDSTATFSIKPYVLDDKYKSNTITKDQ